MEDIYLVNMSGGNPDDCFDYTLFATTDKDLAERYVEKFNRILAKAKDYKKKFEDNNEWIKHEYFEQYYDRWSRITYANICYYTEIEIR